VSLERLILDLEIIREFAEKKNEIITGFISCLQLVALASKPSVVYQEIKFTKRFENVS
jgi:hypothetical protein